MSCRYSRQWRRATFQSLENFWPVHHTGRLVQQFIFQFKFYPANIILSYRKIIRFYARTRHFSFIVVRCCQILILLYIIIFIIRIYVMFFHAVGLNGLCNEIIKIVIYVVETKLLILNAKWQVWHSISLIQFPPHNPTQCDQERKTSYFSICCQRKWPHSFFIYSCNSALHMGKFS